MLAGIIAQPLPQPTIRIIRRVTNRYVVLRGAVLPDHPTREPFTHPHYPLQVVNGVARTRMSCCLVHHGYYPVEVRSGDGCAALSW